MRGLNQAVSGMLAVRTNLAHKAAPGCAGRALRYVLSEQRCVIMDDYSKPGDRPARDYLLFALAFLGFGIAGGGVVLASPFLAISGLVVLLFGVACFGLTAED
jgi:hypothetical protein